MDIQDNVTSAANNLTIYIDLITKHGYPVEVYDNIKTEDGYVLTAFRIPHGLTNKSDTPKPVVMLMHGLVSSCADFLIPGPNRGLGFVLSDIGFDVWLPNVRGKFSSRKHLKLNHEDAQYWNFTFHELGLYDLSAFLEQIEKVTGLRTVAYIGHSQGTVLPFVLLSERPEFNERFNLIITFNPVLVVTNVTSLPYKFLNVSRHITLLVMGSTGKLEFPPRFITNGIVSLNYYFSERNGFLEAVKKFLYMLHGATPDQFVKTDIPLMLQYYPDPTSALVLKHFGQNYNADGYFRKYDYGCEGNLQKYGKPSPPLYDLKNVVSPVVVFCSSADAVLHPRDAQLLCNLLPNCIAMHDMEDPKFSHSDLLYGRYAPTIAYPMVIDHLKKYCQAK